MSVKIISSSAVLALSMLMGNVQAHHIWIEQDAKQAKLYFGEFNLNLREVSPGLLDKISAPTARLIKSSGTQQLVLQKATQAYVINARAAAGDSIIAEEANYPAYDKIVESKTLRAVYRPAARYISDFTVQVPQLTLDVVPTGKPGKLQVYFQDKPLAKAKVIIVAASGWTQELSSDAAGILEVSLPWQGMYAIQATHTDATPGMRGAEAYALVTYVTTLSVVQSTGLSSPPSPSAATASKVKE